MLEDAAATRGERDARGVVDAPRVVDEEESSEEVVMPLHHLGVLARCLRLQLDGWVLPVQEWGHLLTHEASLAIGDEHLHGSKVPDPVRHDRLDEILRLAPFQQ